MISVRFAVGAACVALAIVTLFPTKEAAAHGFAGQRFFPATILTDDPFVADEISLPTVARPPTSIDRSQQIDVDVDLAKRITPDLGFTIGQGWTRLQPERPARRHGPQRTEYRLAIPTIHRCTT